MSNPDDTPLPKRWKNVKILDSFESANSLRDELLSADETSKLQIKIRRCGPGGTRFKVKSWFPPAKNTNKKGKKKNEKRRSQ